ncbi:MAG: lytic transglycosylase domain-containing protein [Mucilaginibacter sp.]|uniref:lytic transglycosylase domain-containing protein n=1 Tax=Mucilaginibacter sp. TaxID=1882438 RepID=UPI0032656D7F
MEKRKMIKKHLVTCSVMAVTMIISRLLIFWTVLPEAVTEISRFKPVSVAESTAGHGSFNVLNGSNYYDSKRVRVGFIAHKNNSIDSLNFADEKLPKHDEKSRGKMKRSLRLHNFSKVQSNILHQKAEKMFPIIEPILKANGIPDDFKYIPLVESGFGEGRSSRGAYGAWQFMPGTARTYGLKVNKNRDERLNLRKSTIAACKYLRELHSEFKSWAMVAAAYNTGSPNLARLMRKQCQCNYFKIKMNTETGAYVYNLIAMKEIINDPKLYGYTYQKPVYGVNTEINGEVLAFN